MPTKFVSNAAERAGVSLETAEYRWAEAKKAVKKGKRRGSWYWGKVMNTFKRMMGLMETVTLKEWLLLEDLDEEPTLLDWPEEFLAGNGWVLTQLVKSPIESTYNINRLMDEKVKGYFYVNDRSAMGGKPSFKSWQINNTNGDYKAHKLFASSQAEQPSDFLAAKAWLAKKLGSGILGEQTSSEGGAKLP